MQSNILSIDEIKRIIPPLDLIPIIEESFVSYSKGLAEVPPIGELIMDKGEVHIKYGYIKGDDYYVIKIASAFYGNPKLGLPSSNGLMLLYSQKTGELVCTLRDEGFLTDTRTAVAGAIAAKYLAPKQAKRIGIIGTGTQARLQLQYLKEVTSCRNVLVCGRGKEQINRYQKDMQPHGFAIESTLNIGDILQSCNVIITTTPSHEPLLKAADLQNGVHITAVGSDTQQKQELEPEILQKADLLVADSIIQCLHRGEIYKAIEASVITEDKLVELGNVIDGNTLGRTYESQITVADLTGVAVQDIKVAEVVYEGSQK